MSKATDSALAKAAARETIIRLAIKEYSNTLTHVDRYHRRHAEEKLEPLELAEARDEAAAMLAESRRLQKQAEDEADARFRRDHPIRAWWRDFNEGGAV